MAKKKNIDNKILFFIAIAIIILFGRSSGLFSILGTASGWRSIEPTSLDAMYNDTKYTNINRTFSGIEYDYFRDPDAILFMSEGVLASQDSRPENINESMRLFGVFNVSSVLQWKTSTITQEDVNKLNNLVVEKYGINPGITMTDVQQVQLQKCDAMVNLYKKFIPIIVSDSFKNIDVFEGANLTIHQTGLLEEIKGRDIYYMNLMLQRTDNLYNTSCRTESYFDYETNETVQGVLCQQQVVGQETLYMYSTIKGWCNQNNQLFNFEVDAKVTNTPSQDIPSSVFDKWYFDNYFVEDKYSGWYSWAPDLFNLGKQKSALLIVFGIIGITYLFMSLSKKD